MRFSELFNFSGKIGKECPKSIELNGPFISENYILTHSDKYVDLLKDKKSNLTIARDMLILSEDKYYLDRDNIRLELGIEHHKHNIEINLNEPYDYSVIAIDYFYLLNPSDANTIKDYINTNYPLTMSELSLYNKFLHGDKNER